MKYDPTKHHRRSIRLKGYDYSLAAAYFITICAYERECLFGEITDGVMQLNEIGQIVADEWERSPEIRPEIELDNWIIMPNHIHGIFVICESANDVAVGANDVAVGANGRSPLPIRMKPRSLSSFVSGFKSATTRRINLTRNAPGTSVWQRNYYDHIIRNESSLQNIRQYICNNPLSWEVDQLHPDNPSKW